MGQTIIEKILSSHCRQEAHHKEIVVAGVDCVMGRMGLFRWPSRLLKRWAARRCLTGKKLLL